MAMTPEGKVKKVIKESIAEYAKMLGEEVWYDMPVKCGMGSSGIPDFIGCVNGDVFFIEAKAAGKELTPLQEQHRARIKKAKGWYFVARPKSQSKEDLAVLGRSVALFLLQVYDGKFGGHEATKRLRPPC